MTTFSVIRSKISCKLVISIPIFNVAFAFQFSFGAVKRLELEKSEPTISYNAFVEDLDPGDSFTTTLTELLVRVHLFLPLYVLITNHQNSL
jgi:hypothetical protein